MNDLISRKEVLRCISKSCDGIDWGQSEDGDAFLHYTGVLYRIIASARHVPTIDAVPVVHGRWIKKSDRTKHWHCSNCAFVEGIISRFYNYCPNCGAKMDGRDDDATD